MVPLGRQQQEKDLVEFNYGICRKKSEHTKLVERKAGQELYCRWRELKALVEGPLSDENIKKSHKKMRGLRNRMKNEKIS